MGLVLSEVISDSNMNYLISAVGCLQRSGIQELYEGSNFCCASPPPYFSESGPTVLDFERPLMT